VRWTLQTASKLIEQHLCMDWTL